MSSSVSLTFGCSSPANVGLLSRQLWTAWILGRDCTRSNLLRWTRPTSQLTFKSRPIAASCNEDAQLDVVFEFLRTNPMSLCPLLPCDGNPAGDLGPIAQHVLSWCYMYKHPGRVLTTMKVKEEELCARLVATGGLPIKLVRNRPVQEGTPNNQRGRYSHLHWKSKSVLSSKLWLYGNSAMASVYTYLLERATHESVRNLVVG